MKKIALALALGSFAVVAGELTVTASSMIALAADRGTRRYNEGETATVSLTLSEPFSADWIAERMGVSTEWIESHSALAKSMLEATAANGRLSVVECYVLGIDPEDPGEDFEITWFGMKADGSPDLENIRFSPPREKWSLGLQFRLKGKATLADEWQDVPDAGEPTFRFFKAEAVLP